MMQYLIKIIFLIFIAIAVIASIYYVIQNRQQPELVRGNVLQEIVCGDGEIYLYDKCEPMPEGAYLVVDDSSFEDCKKGHYVDYRLSYPKNHFICLKIPESGFKVESYDWECEYPYVKGLVGINQLGCSVPPENASITRDCGWEDNFVPSDCGAKCWSCNAGYKEVFGGGMVSCEPI